MGATRSWLSVVAGLALAGAGLVPVGGPEVAAAAPVPAVAPSAPVVSEFSDVPVGAPFRLEIEWLASTGITTGWPDGTFHPSAPVERQAMAAFLYRFAGSPAFTPPSTASFSDVSSSHPFFLEIEWLASTGITTGYPDHTFHPSAPVERQAMAAFLYRYAGSPAFTAPETASFSDVPVGAPFRLEIEWLAQTGITTGYPDRTFHPSANVERQAMAAFLYRYASTVGDHEAPSPVGFVGVSGVTETSVTLGWTAPTDADVAGVVVRRAEGPTPPASASDGALVADLGPAATGVTDSGLVAGTVYSYAVFARDAAGNVSVASTTNAATTPVLVDEVSYTLAAGVQEAASGDVTDVSPTAGEVPVDASGAPTGDAAPWQATVILAPGAPAPGVGDDFVIAPGDPTYPEGVAGVVTGVVANGDGTTTLTLGPVALDEVFADLHVTYSGPVGDGTWDPAADAAADGAAAADLVPDTASLSAATIAASTGTQAPSAQALAAAASGAVLDCEDDQGHTVTDTVELATEIRFENLGWHFEADLGSLWADPFLAMWVSAEPVVSVSGAAITAMTCEIAPAWTAAHTRVIPVPGFPGTTLSLGPYLEFEINAAADVELSQRMYWMGGFITNPDGTLRELRGSSADPIDLNVSGQLEVAVGAGLTVQLGYLDHAGIYGKAGFELAGSVSASAGSDNELCATAHLDAVASMGVFLDVWVARWEYQALTLSARLWSAETCFEPLPSGAHQRLDGVSITWITPPHYTWTESWGGSPEGPGYHGNSTARVQTTWAYHWPDPPGLTVRATNAATGRSMVFFYAMVRLSGSDFDAIYAYDPSWPEAVLPPGTYAVDQICLEYGDNQNLCRPPTPSETTVITVPPPG